MRNSTLVPFARVLRKTATPAEKKLWFMLRQLKFERGHFRRQVPLENYIVDFAFLQAKLRIEIDGESHFTASGKQNDLAREAVLKSLGFRILRFTNVEVMENCEGVVEDILKHIQLPHLYPPLLAEEC